MRSNGGWSTRWRRPRRGTSGCASTRWRWLQPRIAGTPGKASRCRRSTARSSDGALAYQHVRVALDRGRRRAEITVHRAAARPGRPRRDARRRRRVLAARDGARARRRDPASALQRARTRHNRVPLGGRSRRRAGLPMRCSTATRGDWLVREIRLLLKRMFEAHRPDRAQPVRADRAGQLLCRQPCRAGLRRRPRPDVRRRAKRRQSRRRRPCPCRRSISAPFRWATG